MRFSYPCEVSRDSETGQVIVECKNPSAFAFGDSLEEAVKEMHSLLLDHGERLNPQTIIY